MNNQDDLSPIAANDRVIGYVQSDFSNGNRVVIVIDDYFEVLTYMRLTKPQSHQRVMIGLYSEIYSLERTCAIGFFKLSSPRKIAREGLMIIREILDWLSDLEKNFSGVELDIFMLVDFYYGEVGSSNKNVGSEFINLWKQQIDKFKPTYANRVKMKYLSQGLPIEFDDDHHLGDVVSKFDISYDPITKQGRVPPALLEWIGDVEHPMECIWRKTKNWFLNDHNTPIMKHNFLSIKETMKRDSNFLADYKKEVEDLFGFKFPKEWWSNVDSFEHIHEALKRLCGSVSCGGTDASGRRTLSVGSVYLVALLAYYRNHKNIDVLIKHIPDWQDIACNEPVFSLQPQRRAKTTVMALYDLFERLFDKSHIDHGVKKVLFKEKGRRLDIQLNWSAKESAKDTHEESLVEKLSDMISQRHIIIPTTEGENPSAQKLTHAIIRLWHSMLFNDDGFGSSGVIFLKDDTLIIKV